MAPKYLFLLLALSHSLPLSLLIANQNPYNIFASTLELQEIFSDLFLQADRASVVSLPSTHLNFSLRILEIMPTSNNTFIYELG